MNSTWRLIFHLICFLIKGLYCTNKENIKLIIFTPCHVHVMVWIWNVPYRLYFERLVGCWGGCRNFGRWGLARGSGSLGVCLWRLYRSPVSLPCPLFLCFLPTMRWRSSFTHAPATMVFCPVTWDPWTECSETVSLKSFCQVFHHKMMFLCIGKSHDTT